MKKNDNEDLPTEINSWTGWGLKSTTELNLHDVYIICYGLFDMLFSSCYLEKLELENLTVQWLCHSSTI